MEELLPERPDNEETEDVILFPLTKMLLTFDIHHSTPVVIILLIWNIKHEYLIALITAFMNLLKSISRQVITQQKEIG